MASLIKTTLFRLAQYRYSNIPNRIHIEIIMEKRNYIAPLIEVIEIEMEEVIAFSDGKGDPKSSPERRTPQSSYQMSWDNNTLTE